MSITLTRLDPAGTDREALIAFMTGNEFPFHVVARPTAVQVAQWIDAGAYRDDDNDSFWLDDADRGRVGFVRLEDLSDGAPLFDLRLAMQWRGAGVGTAALHAATDHVFRSMPQVRRFEGQTRQDNIAMRRVFVRCGWVKEAHYREGWPGPDGRAYASVAYGMLRADWESGTTTALVWDDLA